MKEKQRKKKTRESGKLPQRLSSVGFAGAVLLVSAICGCGAGTARGAEEAAAFALPEMPELAAAIQVEAEQIIEAEIEITYPFPGGLEDYRLVCRPVLPEMGVYLKGAAADVQEEAFSGSDEYELRLYNGEGELLQRLSCGRITEDTEFRFDDLSFEYGNELEIFTPDDTGEAQSGLLFAWNYVEDIFFTEPIVIPAYQEVWNGFMMSTDTEGAVEEQRVYAVDRGAGKAVPARSRRIDRDAGTLEIWNELEDRRIFEGSVSFGSEGGLADQEYYDFLFRDGLSNIAAREANETVRTWLEGVRPDNEESPGQNIEAFENMQGTLWGYEGHTAEFPDREAFLEACGFLGREPFYEYQSWEGDLILELYLDERTGLGCGVRYVWSYATGGEKKGELYGFTFVVEQGEWEGHDPFAMSSESGSDGSELVTEYEKALEYRDDGQPDWYQSQGVIEWLRDDMGPYKILDINWIYRETGKLFYREFYQNSHLWGTTRQALYDYYDEDGRLIYESAYITHGSLDYFFIYTDGSDRPAYCLQLDNNLGYCIPLMVELEY